MMYRYGLYRDPSKGWIAGVAAGLGERFGVSTGIIRLVFVLFALTGTPVLAAIVYAVLAVLIPAKPLVIGASYRRQWRREY
ncbi:MAG: PspC domain [Rhodospirillales bacterium]|nr:PspC domain [Rhodospirillales bacterium]